MSTPPARTKSSSPAVSRAAALATASREEEWAVSTAWPPPRNPNWRQIRSAIAPDWLPARASPLTSGTAAKAVVAWPRARARSAGGTSPAASAVASTARTNGHRVRNTAARDTSPVRVFPMMTPARSRASPCAPGKPASASARPAVSSASQWAGSVARYVCSGIANPARSNCHPSSTAARGAAPLAAAARPAPGPVSGSATTPCRPGGAAGTRAARPGRSQRAPADCRRPGTCRLGRRWQSVLRCRPVRGPQA